MLGLGPGWFWLGWERPGEIGGGVHGTWRAGSGSEPVSETGVELVGSVVVTGTGPGNGVAWAGGGTAWVVACTETGVGVVMGSWAGVETGAWAGAGFVVGMSALVEVETGLGIWTG